MHRYNPDVIESYCFGLCPSFTGVDENSRLPNYVFSALAAAGLYSNAEDMTRFIRAHWNSSRAQGAGVLRASTLQSMLQAQMNSLRTSPLGESYMGLGIRWRQT